MPKNATAPAGTGADAGDRTASDHSKDTPNYHLSSLASATRRARAEAILARLDRSRDRALTRWQLTNAFVREYRGDARDWTAAQLDLAIDDLAAGGLVTVHAGDGSGELTIYRVPDGSA
jgi:hypothetical protein